MGEVAEDGVKNVPAKPNQTREARRRERARRREEQEAMREEMMCIFAKEFEKEKQKIIVVAQEIIQKETKAAQREAEKIKKAAEQKAEIACHICRMMVQGHSADEIKESLRQEFGLSARVAEEKYREVTE